MFFICTNIFYCLFLARQPPVGQGLLIHEVSRRSRTTTLHSRLDLSRRVISLSQRPLPDNTQHSQKTDFHGPGGIRTHNLSRRAAADLCLRPSGTGTGQYLVLCITIQNVQHQTSRLKCSCWRISGERHRVRAFWGNIQTESFCGCPE